MGKSGMASIPDKSRLYLDLQVALWRVKVKESFLSGYIDHEACRQFTQFMASAAVDDIAKEAERELLERGDTLS